MLLSYTGLPCILNIPTKFRLLEDNIVKPSCYVRHNLVCWFWYQKFFQILVICLVSTYYNLKGKKVLLMHAKLLFFCSCVLNTESILLFSVSLKLSESPRNLDMFLRWETLFHMVTGLKISGRQSYFATIILFWRPRV